MSVAHEPAGGWCAEVVLVKGIVWPLELGDRGSNDRRQTTPTSAGGRTHAVSGTQGQRGDPMIETNVEQARQKGPQCLGAFVHHAARKARIKGISLGRQAVVQGSEDARLAAVKQLEVSIRNCCCTLPKSQARTKWKHGWGQVTESNTDCKATSSTRQVSLGQSMPLHRPRRTHGTGTHGRGPVYCHCAHCGRGS